jgi:hypothetical protein
MAPEQWRGQYQDGATDQYALAVLVYELLAGRLPFESPDMSVLKKAVLESQPRKPDCVTDARSLLAGKKYNEAEGHLTPTLKFEVTAEGMSGLVKASVIPLNGSAATDGIFKLEKGRSYEFEVSYATGKRRWQNQKIRMPVNWTGLKTERIQLDEARGPVERTDWTSPATGMKFVWIEAMQMWVGQFEVTNDEYNRFDRSHDSQSYGDHPLTGARQPVVNVNFEDAKKYVTWLNQQDAVALSGTKYRLPTEDEWLAFAQCGKNWTYPWGNDWSAIKGNYHGQEGAGSWDKIAGYNDGHPVTCDVEESRENTWGLYGVGGNVWELTAQDKAIASFGAWRGASWIYYGRGFLRCDYRNSLGGSYRDFDYGFRLVLSR